MAVAVCAGEWKSPAPDDDGLDAHAALDAAPPASRQVPAATEAHADDELDGETDDSDSDNSDAVGGRAAWFISTRAHEGRSGCRVRG